MSKKNRNAVAPSVETIVKNAKRNAEIPNDAIFAADEAPSVPPSSVVLTRVESKYKGFETFAVEGRKGKIWFSTSLFAGDVPATLTVEGVTLAPEKVPTAKLSPEERKAEAAKRAEARKAETPAEKAERAKAVAVAAAKRAELLAEYAAKADAANAKTVAAAGAAAVENARVAAEAKAEADRLAV